MLPCPPLMSSFWVPSAEGTSGRASLDDEGFVSVFEGCWGSSGLGVEEEDMVWRKAEKRKVGFEARDAREAARW